jgi:hypothetical protein
MLGFDKILVQQYHGLVREALDNNRKSIKISQVVQATHFQVIS